MPAHIDEANNNLHVNTLVLYASIENVALIADIPNFFSKNRKILPMYRWFVYSMFLNSDEHAASFLVPGGFSSLFKLGLILLPQFPGGLKDLLLSTHLTIFDLRFRITVLPVSWCLADSFSFIVILRIDSRSQT